MRTREQYEAARERFKAFGGGEIFETALDADGNGPALDYLKLTVRAAPVDAAEVAGRLALLTLEVDGHLSASVWDARLNAQVAVSVPQATPGWVPCKVCGAEHSGDGPTPCTPPNYSTEVAS